MTKDKQPFWNDVIQAVAQLETYPDLQVGVQRDDRLATVHYDKAKDCVVITIRQETQGEQNG